MRTGLMALSIAALTFAALGQEGATGEVPLIPRDVFFENPDRAAVQISPDGAHLSWLAPVDGVLNIWLAPVSDPSAARPITRDAGRGIRQYQWAWTNRHILYLQDEGGDENWQLHVVDIATREDRNLTPFDSIPGPDGQPIMLPSGKPMRPAVRIEGTSPDHPQSVLIGINNRDPQWHDLHRVDLVTGNMELVQLNEGYLGYVSDNDLRVRFAVRMEPDSGTTILAPDGAGGWSEFMTIPGDDSATTNILGFDRSGKYLLLTDSRERDTAALMVMDIETKKTQILCHDPRADVTGAMLHPTEGYAQAAASNPMRVEWHVIDLTIENDFKKVKGLADGDMSITSRTADDRKWIAAFILDNGPVKYYLYDRDSGKETFLFTNRDSLEGLPLAHMYGVKVPARDGMNLVSYLTLPVDYDTRGNGRPSAPLPMVLLVHGGPWARDSWGYNGLHQWLANRGYAVLSVNYRGSTGFGKKFLNAADQEWAGEMHEDLLDAVKWAVREDIADPTRVAIMGGSYGGYATLVGLTFTPDVFACGVDIVGPSNLNTLLNTIPPYWKPLMDYWARRVGDPRTEEGRRLLDERSPLNRVDAIERPLLIGQGANDPRVKQSESDQIVAAMREKGIPVTYVLFPDEGHGFARPPNSKAFFAVTDAFLATHLGGRSEPVGDDFDGSTIQVLEGESQVPGLSEALANRRP